MTVMLSPRILNEDLLFGDEELAAEHKARREGKSPREMEKIRRELGERSMDKLAGFPRVLAVDPGTASGWCVLWFDPDVVFDLSRRIASAHVAFWCGVLLGDEDSQVDHLLDIGRKFRVGGDGLALVHETFRVRSVKMQHEFLSPVRVSAAHKWAARRGVRDWDSVVRRRKVYFQEPVDAKSVATDDRLRLWGMYVPGVDHPRDATRHAVLWVRLLRNRGEGFYDLAHFVDAVDADDGGADVVCGVPGMHKVR